MAFRARATSLGCVVAASARSRVRRRSSRRRGDGVRVKPPRAPSSQRVSRVATRARRSARDVRRRARGRAAPRGASRSRGGALRRRERAVGVQPRRRRARRGAARVSVGTRDRERRARRGVHVRGAADAAKARGTRGKRRDKATRCDAIRLARGGLGFQTRDARRETRDADADGDARRGNLDAGDAVMRMTDDDG